MNLLFARVHHKQRNYCFKDATFKDICSNYYGNIITTFDNELYEKINIFYQRIGKCKLKKMTIYLDKISISYTPAWISFEKNNDKELYNYDYTLIFSINDIPERDYGDYIIVFDFGCDKIIDFKFTVK